ncbi:MULTISPECIES: hypothetical protein [Streptomyces]|uniref:Uncharacterized protein n=1 Tax=Streptomyces evansiae TaxID=3075535 RepID=A0ABU2R0R5_9ACTN|nr:MULTISPECIES: hypothetical protein [unclassified Streptomyces]MDT0409942.1 hypothetical protein [Streptomyces sp. DSM 41979]MYQ59971.1 hypothetical protein [Streptomyces sp. SID4926]SCE40736.1 hypothetical protein GA0115252_146455 [Streptomyces sp. DfronAA-171]
MATEVTLPVHVRVGEAEGCLGELTVEATGGTVRGEDVLHQLAAFFREAADVIEHPTEDDDEEVPDAAAHG